jgi:TP901 family phage tail tape measure protein
MSVVSDLIVRVRGQDLGAVGLMNRLALQMRHNREELAGLNDTANAFGAAGRRMLGVAGGIAGGLLYMGKTAADFDNSLRQVNTMAQLSSQGFAELGDSVLQIARDPLITDMPAKLTTGLYDLYSSGIKGSDAYETLRAAAIGAAGATEDTAIATSMLSDTMNAYHTKTGADAVRIMDQLWASVEKGKFRLSDMAGELGPMVAVAAPLGVSLAEVGAATAVMTNAGFTYSEAATAVERSMTAMLTPTKELQAAMKAQGFESATAMLKARGLAGAMEVVRESAHGDEAQLAALYGNVRALRAAMALSGDGAIEFARDIDYINNSTGAAQRAAKAMAEGPLFQWKKALQELNTELVTVGQQDLLPIGTELINSLREGIAWFRALSPEQKKMYIDFAIGTVKALALGGALAMISGGILKIVQAGQLAKGALGWLGTVLKGGGGAAAAEGAAQTAGALAQGGGGLLGKVKGLFAGKKAGAAAAVARPAEQIMRDMAFRPSASANPAAWTAGLNAFKEAKTAGLVQGAKRAKTAIYEVWSAQTRLAWANQLSASSTVAWGKSMVQWVSKGSNWTGLLTGLKGGFVGLGSGIMKLPGMLAGLGSSLVTFLVSPAGIATLAIVGLAMELAALWKSYKTMRAAQEEAKQKKAETRTAEDAAQAQGVWNFDSTARSMGYSEKEIERIQKRDSSDPEFKKISDLTIQKNRRSAQKKAGERDAARNRAASEAAAAAAAQQQTTAQSAAQSAAGTGAGAAETGAGSTVTPGVYPAPAAYQGGRSSRALTKDASGTYVLNITNARFNTLNDLKARLDQEFGAAQ